MMPSPKLIIDDYHEVVKKREEMRELGSITCCQQVYQYPTPEQEMSEELQEELEEEIEEETVTFASTKTPPYDYLNFIPEFTDLQIPTLSMDEYDFNESLIIYSNLTSRKVGSLDIFTDVQDDMKFFVVMNGIINTGPELKKLRNCGFVDTNYDAPLELRVEESLAIDSDARHSNVLTVIKDFLRYDVKHTIRYEDLESKGQEMSKTYIQLTYDHMVNVITESANILLMRHLAKTDYIGSRYAKCIYINRAICLVEYKCYPFEVIVLGEHNRAESKKIRRRIIMPNNEVSELTALLSRNGQLMKMFWTDELWHASLDPRAVITDTVPKNPIGLIPVRDRMDQFPMFKYYIESATNINKMINLQYLADHDEVNDIISYIVKRILLSKPHKVIHFVKRIVLPYI